ncbi:hypothetical protein GCM10027342_41440 [Photobacterium alginatilyticum]
MQCISPLYFLNDRDDLPNTELRKKTLKLTHNDSSLTGYHGQTAKNDFVTHFSRTQITIY